MYFLTAATYSVTFYFIWTFEPLTFYTIQHTLCIEFFPCQAQNIAHESSIPPKARHSFYIYPPESEDMIIFRQRARNICAKERPSVFSFLIFAHRHQFWKIFLHTNSTYAFNELIYSLCHYNKPRKQWSNTVDQRLWAKQVDHRNERGFLHEQNIVTWVNFPTLSDAPLISSPRPRTISTNVRGRTILVKGKDCQGSASTLSSTVSAPKEPSACKQHITMEFTRGITHHIYI